MSTIPVPSLEASDCASVPPTAKATSTATSAPAAATSAIEIVNPPIATARAREPR